MAYSNKEIKKDDNSDLKAVLEGLCTTVNALGEKLHNNETAQKSLAVVEEKKRIKEKQVVTNENNEAANK